MRKIKLLIWIIVLIILDVSVMRYIKIFNAVPVLTYGFLICTAVLEDDFTETALVGGLCGILGGALLGRGFELVFMFYALSAVAVYYLRIRPRYLHKIFKAIFWCGVLSFVFGIVMYAADNYQINVKAIYSGIIPSAVYNLAAAAMIYPLLEHTVFKNEIKRPLI